jgi:hypothetical protein
MSSSASSDCEWTSEDEGVLQRVLTHTFYNTADFEHKYQQAKQLVVNTRTLRISKQKLSMEEGWFNNALVFQGLPWNWTKVCAPESVVQLWTLLIGDSRYEYIKTQRIVELYTNQLKSAEGKLGCRTCTGDKEHDAMYLHRLCQEIHFKTENLCKAIKLMSEQRIKAHNPHFQLPLVEQK